MGSSQSNDLVARFKYGRLLNQDQSGRRIVLQGTIDDKPALLLAERAAFSTETSHLSGFVQSIGQIQNLGDNDIYRWYMANSLPSDSANNANPPDLKINIIYPSTDKHIKKYSFQQARSVLETPETYKKYIRPYMSRCREEGRLNWVFNILEGREEQENVLYRSKEADKQDDYLLLPDLNWDRTTISGLHLLALVERRDIWSVRDLKKRDVPWLRNFRSTLASTIEKLYRGVEADMLKFYVHYQPTYYHFHVHIVNVSLDAGATQAVGKALGLDNIISQLEQLAGGEDASMADVELSYTVGEASELWTEIYGPLKAGKNPSQVVDFFRRLDGENTIAGVAVVGQGSKRQTTCQLYSGRVKPSTIDNGHGGHKPSTFKSVKGFKCSAGELAGCVGDVGGVAATCGQAVADHISGQQDPATLATGDLGCVFDLIGSGGSCSGCFTNA